VPQVWQKRALGMRLPVQAEKGDDVHCTRGRIPDAGDGESAD
jgi:hypothetical protein